LNKNKNKELTIEINLTITTHFIGLMSCVRLYFSNGWIDDIIFVEN